MALAVLSPSVAALQTVNKRETVLSSYNEAVRKYGRPRRIHSDYAWRGECFGVERYEFGLWGGC